MDSLPLLQRLIEQFRRLPGIGTKTAARLSFFVLNQSEENVKEFADTLLLAHSNIKSCNVCKNLCEDEICDICDNANRDKGVICIVEHPKDIIAFEKLGEYHGLYHVLGGLISPIDDITPDKLYIRELLTRLNGDKIEEIILATNPTIEGEATALYLSKIIKPLGIKVTRLGFGIPVGGELEYADEITLYRALSGRTEI